MNTELLNDLLECSVCLKPLDEHNKVLPCQHTFCKSCLHSIVKSHKELRCPECRIVVRQRVDDLPSNILLIRLLDGIRSQKQPQISSRSEKTDTRRHSVEGILSEPTQDHVKSRNSHVVNTRAVSLHERTASEPMTNKVKTSSPKPSARALFSYKSDQPSDLTFEKGNIIHLLKKVDANWMCGEYNGQKGVFPVNYVEILHPLPVERPYCVALYDFESSEEEQDRDCLHFGKNDRILVIRKVDGNWAEGIFKEKIGIFPLSFVKLNEEAKKLIESMSSPDEARSQHASGLGAAARRISSNKQGGKFTKKRHSFPTFYAGRNRSDAAEASSHRHSVELGASAVSPSSNTNNSSSSNNPVREGITDKSTAVLKPHELVKVHLRRLNAVTNSGDNNASGDGQSMVAVISSTSSSTSADEIRAVQTPKVVSATKVSSRPPPTHQASAETVSSLIARLAASASIVTATYAYQSQKQDELDLTKGEPYRVTEVCNDGWCRGTHIRSGKSGVFPGNYIVPAAHNSPTSVKTPRTSNSDTPTTSASGKVLSPGRTYEQYRQQQKATLDLSKQTKSAKTDTAPASSKPSAPSKPSSASSTKTTPSNSSKHAAPSTSTTTSSAIPSSSSSGRLNSSSAKSYPVRLTSGRSESSKSPPPPRPTPPTLKLPSSSTSLTSPQLHSPSGDSSSECSSSSSVHKEQRKIPDKEKKRDRNHLLKMIGATRKSRTPPPRSSPSPTSSWSNLSFGSNHDKSHSQEKRSLKPLPCDRYIATMNYPANGPEELALRQGDVVVVHSRRPDGWFKGTHQASGKAGHFPSTFVERILPR